MSYLYLKIFFREFLVTSKEKKLWKKSRLVFESSEVGGGGAYSHHNGHPRTTFKENISKLKNIHYELDMNMNIMDESRKEIN